MRTLRYWIDPILALVAIGIFAYGITQTKSLDGEAKIAITGVLAFASTRARAC